MADDDPARDALANVLGALALVVTDEMVRRLVDVEGLSSTSDAAAVSALGQFLEGATLDRVHRVLGMTPSGAVRLVDRLAESDLVSREPGADKRSRAVRLTEQGRRRSDAVRRSRSDYLRELTADLSDAEVTMLRGLLARVVGAVVDLKDGGAWTCRLCDLTACRRDQGECPTFNAAEARARRSNRAADESSTPDIT